MSFWSWLRDGSPSFDGVTPNATVESPASVGQDYVPGDPDGVTFEGDATFSRSLPFPAASPWSGWPGSWDTPNWTQGGLNGAYGMNRLIDTAWSCLDLNSSVLASMPVYRLASGRVASSLPWMNNPDPLVYSSWVEFAKQLFWDYMLGEVFVLPMSHYADGSPMTFRVVPPWLVNVELRGGQREYMLGSEDVTGEILHIRYQGSTVDARGHGPLEAAGARMVTAGLLQRYAQQLAETGGVPASWLRHEKRLEKREADELLDSWVESRLRHAGHPGVLSGPVTLEQTSSMNAKDMALLELSQWNESRVAVALGVPPFLAGLPSGGDSLTYSNVSQLFDFHDRASLRPKASAVMGALSGWALRRGQTVELNRDEYSRPEFKERTDAYNELFNIVDPVTGQRAIEVDEIRSMERLRGDSAAAALTGINESSEAPEPLTGENA